MIQWLSHRDSHLFNSWMNHCLWMSPLSEWFCDSLIKTVTFYSWMIQCFWTDHLGVDIIQWSFSVDIICLVPELMTEYLNQIILS